MKGDNVTEINPCGWCRDKPESGFFPGDFAIDCVNCLTSLSRHMVDYPAKNYEASGELAKEAAIQAWNKLNPKGEERGTQLEAQ
jgi:hypothetical protein